jgi:hypothetical protein
MIIKIIYFYNPESRIKCENVILNLHIKNFKLFIPFLHYLIFKFLKKLKKIIFNLKIIFIL